MTKLFVHQQSAAARATLCIDPKVRGAAPVPRYLLGKFCEHLGSNIYNGMEAQILRNPTFGCWRFGQKGHPVDGGMKYLYDEDRIAQVVRERARRLDLDADALHEAWQDGGAFYWQRLGSREAVRLSPDAGPHGGRAQRVEVLAANAPAGLEQRAYLPLHRTRGFRYRVVARAFEPLEATLRLAREGETLASATLGLDSEWKTFSGELNLPGAAAARADELFGLSLTVAQPANLVLGRVLLYPDDHVGFADPDVIRFLKEAKLPLLRWPGGNFVSGYRWRDGTGPVDARPTRDNPAWEGLEYNFFGTAEFIAFCRAIECEPMICVNGGDGTPEEAAAWVQYCNGGRDTPMGRLRAEHGHPEPFKVRLWEIGNELYAAHAQVHWTTAGGYRDRYRRFRHAMQAADPAIEFLANGNAMDLDDAWNNGLIQEAKGQPLCITDHILTCGAVEGSTDPRELFHAFMGLARVLGDWYTRLRERMRAAGVGGGRLAITELQLFARLAGEEGRLTRENMVTQDSISEALYFATILHECARLAPFVSMITHSATVNHGGGLRKARERVWANPVHYAHQMAAALAGGTPLRVEISCPGYSTSRSFKHIPPLKDVPALDVLAVENGGEIVVSIVHRGAACGSLEIELACEGTSGEAEAVQLSGETWYERNTLEEPERVVPRAINVKAGGDGLRFAVPPFSLTVLRLVRAE